MKPVSILGIVLIALGMCALVYEGITYTTTEEVAKIGPLEVTVEERKSIPLSPVLGVVSLVGGIVLIVAGGRGRDR